MNLEEQVSRLVFDTLEQINEQLPSEKQVPNERETILLGKNGNLDSLGLVNLIVAVEERVEDELGTTITLADEKAMSQDVSPFKSLDTLINYITKLLQESSDE